MKAYFIGLVEHEAWANRILLEALAREPSVAERARAVFAHFCSAPEYWLLRIRGGNHRGHNWWPPFDTEKLAMQIDRNEQTWRDYLTSLPEPIEECTYETVTQHGEHMTFRVVDALTQYHNHSCHHRGQIAVLFRAAGLDPIPTDYFHWILDRAK